MGFNLENKKTWWYVSDDNMMLSHWVENINYDYYDKTKQWSQGVHDSIEQTYHAYIAYGYEPFIEGIKNCWKKIEYTNPIMKKLYGYYYKPQRYPIVYPSMIDISRDHVMYSICAFYKSGMSQDEIWEYVKHLKMGNKIGLTMNTELWLWLRLMSGRKIGNLYYPLKLISQYFGRLQNTLVESISGFGFAKNEEHPSIFKPLLKNEKPKIINILAGLYYPTYATKLTANMLDCIPENWFVKKIRKNSLKFVPKYNYVLKMLFRQELTEEEIKDLKYYKSMSCDRWSDQLNKWYSNRKLYIIEEKHPDKNFTTDNELDRDYALKLYENTL